MRASRDPDAQDSVVSLIMSTAVARAPRPQGPHACCASPHAGFLRCIRGARCALRHSATVGMCITWITCAIPGLCPDYYPWVRLSFPPHACLHASGCYTCKGKTAPLPPAMPACLQVHADPDVCYVCWCTNNSGEDFWSERHLRG